MLTEQIVIGESTSYPLKGILTFPSAAKGAVPGVVLVHGSGSSNMDEKVGKLTPFKDLAEGLARHGIASVRYDKRTFVHARKLMKEKQITVKEETIEDAILAAELLRKDPRICPEQIFLIGHSMGGMLAPRIDAEGGNFRGLILLAGTPRRLEEVMIEQNQEAYQQMNPLLKRIAKKQIEKIARAFDGLYELTDEQAKNRKFMGGTTLYYFKEMGEHPVEAYLKDLQKPLLIMQGQKDFQVKAEKDFRLYQEILKGRANVTCKLYEDLNHVFVPSVYGTILKARQEYNIEQHIGDHVIADIAEWIWAVCG